MFPPYPHTLSRTPIDTIPAFNRYDELSKGPSDFTAINKFQQPAEVANWPQQLTPEQKYNWKMVTSPYTVNDVMENVSPTNSSDYVNQSCGTNNVDTWYRHPVFMAFNDDYYKSMFCPESIDWISNQITIRLRGVHPEGKNIVVPDKSISSVVDSYYNNGFWQDPNLVREQVTMHIVSQIKNEFEMYKINDNLSPWVQLLTADTGMQRISSDIKLNEKRRTQYWSWNY